MIDIKHPPAQKKPSLRGPVPCGRVQLIGVRTPATMPVITYTQQSQSDRLAPEQGGWNLGAERIREEDRSSSCRGRKR